MELTTLFAYLVGGVIFGLLLSTLVEWVWYRGRRRRIDLAAASNPVAAAAPLPTGAQFQAQLQEKPPPGGAGRAERRAEKKQKRARKKAKKAERRQAAAPPPANRPDNLAAIHGIDSLHERRLYQVGVFTWHQLSGMDPESLRQITRALPSSNTQAWIQQARDLATINNRVGASYDGPLPEDLTRIDGLDQLCEDRLYAAGIFTYRQLAERAPGELEAIIPDDPAGTGRDFAAWIAQAHYLLDDYFADEAPIL